MNVVDCLSGKAYNIGIVKVLTTRCKITITIYDIANHVGCSHSTVSRVLNGKGQNFISEATRQNILAAVVELGYRPNRMSRAHTDGSTDYVGLWIPSLHAYFAEMAVALSSTLAKRGYETLVTTTDSDPMVEMLPLKGLISMASPFLINLLAHNAQYFTPIVSIDDNSVKGVDSIAIDFYGTSRQAVEHLISGGRRRVALLIQAMGNIQGNPRRDAYTDAMDAAGLPYEFIEIQIGKQLQEDARETVKEYITMHGAPNGIFCVSDFYAIPAHKAIRELGLQMPEDVALIGFDGLDIGSYLDPQLSSVTVQKEKICKQACDMLLARMKNPSKKIQTVKIVPTLELRGSAT